MKYLEAEGLEYEVVLGNEQMPNIVATIEGPLPGPHLVLNGHLDTFPVGPESQWNFAPFGGELHDGRIYGRGVADMKAGLASLIVAFATSATRGIGRGRLTLGVVSDEEVFGPHGSRHLLSTRKSDVLGDALLSAEPSSPWLIRCGEKGFVWFRASIAGKGGHGSMALGDRNAIHLLLRFLTDLSNHRWQVTVPASIVKVIERARIGLDRAWGEGATDLLTDVSVNVGLIEGGSKLNVAAGEASAEVDLRLPPGATVTGIKHEITEVFAPYAPYGDIIWLNQNEPTFTDPDTSPLFAALQRATADVIGAPAEICVGPPGTDSRLWRDLQVPAAVYGPRPQNVGAPDEHVLVDDLSRVNLVHAQTIQRFLDG
jgi:succinyl-diaminopimelate desuccinylase